MFQEILSKLSFQDLTLTYSNTARFYSRYPKQTNTAYLEELHAEIIKRLEAAQ